MLTERGRLRTIDLLALINLNQPFLILQILFTFYETNYLNEVVSCTEHSLSVSVPCFRYLTYSSWTFLTGITVANLLIDPDKMLTVLS
jgi:hypothetical protein